MYPNLICLSCGLAVSFYLQVFRYEIKSFLAGKKFGTMRYKLLSGFYSVFFGTVDIVYWKGLWDGIDCIFGIRPEVRKKEKAMLDRHILDSLLRSVTSPPPSAWAA